MTPVPLGDIPGNTREETAFGEAEGTADNDEPLEILDETHESHTLLE